MGAVRCQAQAPPSFIPIPLPGCYPGYVPYADGQLLGGPCGAARQCELVSRPSTPPLPAPLPCTPEALPKPSLTPPSLCPNAVTTSTRASWRTTRPPPAFQSYTPSTSSPRSESPSCHLSLPPWWPHLPPRALLQALPFPTPGVTRTASSSNPNSFQHSKEQRPFRAPSGISVCRRKKKHVEYCPNVRRCQLHCPAGAFPGAFRLGRQLRLSSFY